MTARILEPSLENLALAARALRAGELVAIPTETVYGLAGNALDPLALARIFDAKERPSFDPLIVHVPLSARSSGIRGLEKLGLVDPSKLSTLARERAELLLRRFWPGPLTLVLPKLPGVPDLATSGLLTVAVRMPRHPVAQAVLSAAGLPLAAPSANRFGRISPTRACHVLEELGDRIDWIVDGGACEIGVESTVVSIAEDGALALLRPGGTAAKEIETVLQAPLSPPQGAEIAAPGMLESHYAPRKPLLLLQGPFGAASDPALREALAGRPRAIGLLLFQGETPAAERALASMSGAAALVRRLSASGDPTEAARNLFAELRALDASPAEVLLCEPCPIEHGLGHAIADRLRRASARRGDC